MLRTFDEDYPRRTLALTLRGNMRNGMRGESKSFKIKMKFKNIQNNVK